MRRLTGQTHRMPAGPPRDIEDEAAIAQRGVDRPRRRRLGPPSRAEEAKARSAEAALETAAQRRRQIVLALGMQLRQRAQARLAAQRGDTTPHPRIAASEHIL